MKYLRISDCKIVEGAAGGSRALPHDQYIPEPDLSEVEGYPSTMWRITAERQVVLMTPDEQAAVTSQSFKHAVQVELQAVSTIALRMADNPIMYNTHHILATDTAIACITADLVLANRLPITWPDNSAVMQSFTKPQAKELLAALVDHRRQVLTTASEIIARIKTIAADITHSEEERIIAMRKVRQSHA